MENEFLAELSPLDRLLFVYLWMLADRDGRLEDRPKKIKAKALAYDPEADVDTMLNDLQSRGFLVRYAVDGRKFIQIVNFSKHQKPHSNETKSEIPPCPQELLSMVESYCAHGDEDCEEDVEALGPCISDSLIDRLTDSPIALVPNPPAGSSVAKRNDRPRPEPKAESPASETWRVYAVAYFGRYRTEPVRNATVNSQMSNFVKRIGQEESPAVAAWYVSHNGRYYVQNCHPVSAMLKDAEKLRTEWATRRQVTAAEAVQADKTQTNLNSFGPLIEEARAREARGA
jgi:hypothetical protein